MGGIVYEVAAQQQTTCDSNHVLSFDTLWRGTRLPVLTMSWASKLLKISALAFSLILLSFHPLF